MAIAFVQNGGQGNSTVSSSTVTQKPSFAASAGDLLVLVIAAAPSATRTLNTVTDTQGNTWTVDVQRQQSTTNLIAIASSVLTVGLATTDTITATFSGAMSTNTRYALTEFSGVKSTAWTELTANAAGTGTSLTSGTTGAATAGDLGFAAFAVATLASFTQDASHTKITGVSAASVSLGGEYNVNVSGAQSSTMTSNASAGWSGAQVTYLAAGGTTFAQTLSATATVNPSLVKSVAKVLSQTVTVSPSIVKQIAKTLSLTVTASPTLLTQKVKVVILSVVATVNPSITKAVSKTLSQTVTVNPTLAAALTTIHQVALTVTVTVNASLQACCKRGLKVVTDGALGIVGFAKGALGITPKTHGSISPTPLTDGSQSLPPLSHGDITIDPDEC